MIMHVTMSFTVLCHNGLCATMLIWFVEYIAHYSKGNEHSDLDKLNNHNVKKLHICNFVGGLGHSDLAGQNERKSNKYIWNGFQMIFQV